MVNQRGDCGEMDSSQMENEPTGHTILEKINANIDVVTKVKFMYEIYK